VGSLTKQDVVVVGLGVMGAATLWKLAEAGVNVLGVERFGPTHASGSSHGATRIFRRAYMEGEIYIPLLNRANDLWIALQEQTGRQIIVPTGGVFIGPKGAGVSERSQRTAVACDIPHEMWDAGTIRERIPAFRVILADEARLQMLNEAVRHGATIWYGDPIESLKSAGDRVTARTRRGVSVEATAAVITIGPWAADGFVQELKTHITPTRVPIYWFAPHGGQLESFDYRSFPVFLHEFNDGTLLYGIGAGASAERGVKIGFHNRQHLSAAPDGTSPLIGADQRAEISRYVEMILPGLVPRPIEARMCYYTMSRDESFLIGTSQNHRNLHYASACSGHGFKFATAIGEALSHLAQVKAPSVSLASFRVDRFAC
jgi:sarcosine oxidase